MILHIMILLHSGIERRNILTKPKPNYNVSNSLIGIGDCEEKDFTLVSRNHLDSFSLKQSEFTNRYSNFRFFFGFYSGGDTDSS